LPIKAEHGDIHSLGFRIGDVAYLPDMKRISDEQNLAKLDGLEVLIVDALREIEHPAHMSLEESLEFIELVKPDRAILTNLRLRQKRRNVRLSALRQFSPQK